MNPLVSMTAMVLVVCALWVLLRFNRAIQQLKYFQEAWPRIDELLADRKRLLEEFMAVWERMFNTLPKEENQEQQGLHAPASAVVQAQPQEEKTQGGRVKPLQAMLNKESGIFWEDLLARAKVWGEIESLAVPFFHEAGTHPLASQNRDYNELRRALQENTEELQSELLRFNKAVTTYNRQLSRFPNNLTGYYFGVEPVPVFRVKLATP